MRKIILTGAVLAMLTSAAPMVHAIDPDVQAKLNEKVDQTAYNDKINELEGKVGKVDGLDKKIDNIQKDLDGKITENKNLIQGDDGNGGLKKELADLKSVVGEDDKKGLQKKVHELEKAKLGYDIAITSINAVVKGDNGNGGLKKDVEDLKKFVGENDTEGLQKSVKENKKLLVGDNGNGGLQERVKTIETNAEAQRNILTTLDTMAKENKKLLVGADGNGGLKKDVDGLKKDVEDNKNKITQADNKADSAKAESAAANQLALEVKQKIDAMANGQNDVKKDIAELGGRINVTGAMSAALAGLKPLQYDPMAPTQVMGSVSTYEGQQAYALGLAHFTSEDLMVHGGVSFTNSHKYMANVGVTYKFGHSAEKSMIPMRYQAGPISSIYVMQKENEMMREKMAQQEERIAQLEEMIMNMKK
ncbi:YadA-like family protein [Dialister micraerophilus]|uniref:YadA-like family protein n=1 Tax=Dialister micraerophilus TaxID=309120 RepID=UPI0023F216B1|nr:YadA-like family protein [Dialister micraerophilus]